MANIRHDHNKWYVGINRLNRVAFQAQQIPTNASHGIFYQACIGPFKTKRGAIWAANYPMSLCRTVAEYERAATRN